MTFEYDGTTPGEPQSINVEEEKEQITSKPNLERNASQRNSVLYGRLLSETEINKVRDRWNEDTQNLLDDAMRKHVSIISIMT